MTEKELRAKFEQIIRNEVYPNNEDMQDFVINLNEYLIELSDERIVGIEKPMCLGDVYYFEEVVETLRKCLKGTRKCKAFVTYRDTLDNCKLVTVVCYKAGSEPKWLKEDTQRASKLWKRDIKHIIAGYQAMIKQYKRSLGGAED